MFAPCPIAAKLTAVCVQFQVSSRCYDAISNIIPARNKVHYRRYLLRDSKILAELISSDNWDRVVFPGSEVSMAMLLSKPYATSSECPRMRCPGVGRDRAGLQSSGMEW
jgi:hypothetical protein